MTTTAKHTPGPWRAGDEARDGTIRIFSEKPYGSVADANSCYAGRVKHDAALIAASPKLLELAEAFVSYLEDDSRSERRRAACLEEARALIAEAKGEK